VSIFFKKSFQLGSNTIFKFIKFEIKIASFLHYLYKYKLYEYEYYKKLNIVYEFC
jgi:hypothetical protein